MPIDWSKGFSARYYATIVDPKTWRDIYAGSFVSPPNKQPLLW